MTNMQKLERLKLVVEIALMIAIATGLLLFLRDLGLLTKHLDDTITATNRVIAKTEKVEDAVFTATSVFSAQVAGQQADWQKSQLQVYKTITDTKEILVRTDKSLNDVLVPRLARSLDASVVLQNTAAENMTGTAVRVDATLDALRPMIENGIRATSAAADTMSDPEIRESIKQFSAAAENSAIATREAAGAMSDVHRVTTYEAKQITAPVTAVKAVALEAARFAGKFLGF